MNMDNAISPDNHHSHHNIGGAVVGLLFIWASIFAIFFIMLLCCSCCGRPILLKPVTNDDASPSAADDGAAGDAAPIQIVIQHDALPLCTFHQLKAATAAASSYAICQADYNGVEAVRVQPECCHVFHRSCIDPWLRVHATCPACRNPTLPPLQ